MSRCLSVRPSKGPSEGHKRIESESFQLFKSAVVLSSVTVRSTKRLPIGWPVLTTQFNIKTTLQFNVIPATEVQPLWLALLPDKLVMTGNQGWNKISDCH